MGNIRRGISLVLVAIVVFAKICSWAKTLKLPGKVAVDLYNSSGNRYSCLQRDV